MGLELEFGVRDVDGTVPPFGNAIRNGMLDAWHKNQNDSYLPIIRLISHTSRISSGENSDRWDKSSTFRNRENHHEVESSHH